jgi:hypothetical protein
MNYLVAIFLKVLISWALTSCTATETRSPAVTFSEYKKNTTLMLNLAEKFMSEKDARKLHEVAVATQLARAVTCTDISGECDSYSEFVNLVIRGSEDGVVSPTERDEMGKTLVKLRSSIDRGLRELSAATK